MAKLMKRKGTDYWRLRIHKDNKRPEESLKVKLTSAAENQLLAIAEKLEANVATNAPHDKKLLGQLQKLDS